MSLLRPALGSGEQRAEGKLTGTGGHVVTVERSVNPCSLLQGRGISRDSFHRVSRRFRAREPVDLLIQSKPEKLLRRSMKQSLLRVHDGVQRFTGTSPITGPEGARNELPELGNQPENIILPHHVASKQTAQGGKANRPGIQDPRAGWKKGTCLNLTSSSAQGE